MLKEVNHLNSYFKITQWKMDIPKDVYGLDVYQNYFFTTNEILRNLDTNQDFDLDNPNGSTRVRFYDLGRKLVIVLDRGDVAFFTIDYQNLKLKETKTLKVYLQTNSWGLEIIDEKYLIMGGNSNFLGIVDLENQVLLKVQKYANRIMSVSGKGDYFIFGGYDGVLRKCFLQDFSIQEKSLEENISSVFYENENEFYVGLDNRIIQMDSNMNKVHEYKTPDRVYVYSLFKFKDIFVFGSFMKTPNQKKVYLLKDNEYESRELQDMIWEIRRVKNSFFVADRTGLIKYELIEASFGEFLHSNDRTSKIQNIYFGFL